MPIHFVIVRDEAFRYICNGACGTTPGKRTNDYFKVTCQNCKNKLDKEKPK